MKQARHDARVGLVCLISREAMMEGGQRGPRLNISCGRCGGQELVIGPAVAEEGWYLSVWCVPCERDINGQVRLVQPDLVQKNAGDKKS